MKKLLLYIFFLNIFLPNLSYSDVSNLNVAVASNVIEPIQQIVKKFNEKNNQKFNINIISGATGKLYAQILNGAPFDIILSADSSTIDKLQNKKYIISDTRVTYALGRLVLWSKKKDFIVGSETLNEENFNYLAIANPKTAPYGAAAYEVLENLKIKETVSSKIVQGHSVSQSYQFVNTGHAKLGFVAISQVYRESKLYDGSIWIIPTDLYGAIQQDAAILKKTKNYDLAEKFLGFLKSNDSLKILSSYGYEHN